MYSKLIPRCVTSRRSGKTRISLGSASPQVPLLWRFSSTHQVQPAISLQSHLGDEGVRKSFRNVALDEK
ncbi:hypothetical protein RRG08_038626 [Elysia crispata]|uniref:Uncharacterized protein n=1 Tax=Elysia crispata TaxID=231223 RepID=A0AAE1D170_9GAST|nr:hypothetical protein RRG08_038626 [Elysia crispata]